MELMVEIVPALLKVSMEEEGSLGVLVVSDAPSGRVLDVVRSVASVTVGEGDALWGISLEVQETMRGPAIVLTDVGPPDVNRAVQQLATLIGSAGLPEAKLTRMPTVNPWGRKPDDVLDMVRCWMVLRGSRPNDWRGRRGWPPSRPIWDVSDADKAAALGFLVEWALGLPGRGAAAAVTNGSVHVPVPFDAVLPMMLRAEQHPSWLHVNRLTVTAGNSFRALDVRRLYGLALASDGVRNGATLDWRSSADAVREVIDGAGEWCTYAHVNRGHGTVGTSVSDIRKPSRGATLPQDYDADDCAEQASAGMFFDAYGLVRVPRHKAARLVGLWDTAERDGDTVVASVKDLEPWLSRPAPSDDVLAAGRAALNIPVDSDAAEG